MSDYQHIVLEKDEQTVLLKINRPQVYNALTKDAKFEIIKAMEEIAKDSSVRSVVITGEGKAFCTGQDLNDRSVSASEQAVDLGNTLQTEWNPLVASIRNCPKIVIGAINGVSAGAGVSIAMACDLIVAHPKASFISGFSKIGLAPDAGSSFTFTRALGKSKTLEFFLFNKPLSSNDMMEAGLINSVADDVVESAMELARNVNEMAPLSVARIKRNVISAQDECFSDCLEHEITAQRELGNSKDYQEGVKAFLEKRKPQFIGQ